MPLTLDTIVSVSDDAVFRELEGEAVVLDLESGMYYGLDEVGTCVWRAIEPSGALSKALDSVLAEFDAERAAAEADLLELASTLIDKGLWTAA
ncbi:MAG TPA: PqqD family peptide modification chaperone [Vicinamibacterales bacterium]|jgi:hypothetical protein